MNIGCWVGRLTHSPELRHTDSGKAVCNFTLAVERRFKDADGNAVTDYIDFVAWQGQAEFLCKWFDKGVRVGVTGELQTRKYEKDGQTRKITEVAVSSVEFADGKREATTTNTADTNTFANDTADDFIPVEDDVKMPLD